MCKIPIFLILLFPASNVPAGPTVGSAPAAPLLRDGLILTGVDGTLMRQSGGSPDSNDVWLFELSTDVNDSAAAAKAGTRLEMLPSSALERMIADAKVRSTPTYRLWNSRVTKYKGRNFIFPNYFQPLRKARDARQETEGRPQTSDLGKSDLAVDEPNDVLTLPPELLEKLRASREKGVGGGQQIADANQAVTIALQAVAERGNAPNTGSYTQGGDFILAERTAFLVKQNDGRFLFVPDALGRNIQRLSVCPLACEALEVAEREQSAEPEPARFKITGIMTRYKGNNYLLLQRATRAYSHGNFGR
jgi:hypothetical protein